MGGDVVDCRVFLTSLGLLVGDSRGVHVVFTTIFRGEDTGLGFGEERFREDGVFPVVAFPRSFVDEVELDFLEDRGLLLGDDLGDTLETFGDSRPVLLIFFLEEAGLVPFGERVLLGMGLVPFGERVLLGMGLVLDTDDFGVLEPEVVLLPVLLVDERGLLLGENLSEVMLVFLGAYGLGRYGVLVDTGLVLLPTTLEADVEAFLPLEPNKVFLPVTLPVFEEITSSFLRVFPGWFATSRLDMERSPLWLFKVDSELPAVIVVCSLLLL